MKASDFSGDLNTFLAFYKFQPELTKRLDPDIESVNVENLIHGWTLELAELMGAAGINSIESLRGNRDRLRGYMLDEGLMKVLDVQSVGA